MSDMDPGLSLYISMWSITAVKAADHSQMGLRFGGGKIKRIKNVTKQKYHSVCCPHSNCD